MVTKYCHVPWARSEITRPKFGPYIYGKPCYIPPEVTSSDHKDARIDFNVSHQNGIVTLIAAIGFQGKVEVGTDVVSVNENTKQNYEWIEKDGFFSWMNMYEEMFAASEIEDMKKIPVPVKDHFSVDQLTGYGLVVVSVCQRRNGKLTFELGNGEVSVESNDVIDAKLRRFYSMWCLREAYVKMVGEGLLAPWLRELEISVVQSPNAKEGIRDENSLEPGESRLNYKEGNRDKILLEADKSRSNFVIHSKGESGPDECISLGERERKSVTNVKMKLTALGNQYMVAGAVRHEIDQDEPKLGNWEELDLETDILMIAESS